MRILLDQGTPAPLRRYLQQHSVETAFEMGWSNLSNGELLTAAEGTGFELLITTDQQWKHQQNLAERRLAVLVLLSTSWPRIRSSLDQVLSVLERMQPGDYGEIEV